jgi:ABC transport system ATP-binding/permease protein
VTDIVDRLRGLGEQQSVVVGAGQGAGLFVEGPGVSPEHARIARRGGRLVVRDLDSWEGTFVNGAEVRGLVPLRAGDRLRLGGVELEIPAVGYVPTASGPVAVTVEEGSKAVPGDGGEPRFILKGVDLHIPAGQFVGILGASGSGKSTLTKALAGLTELTSGEVRLNGVPTPPQDLRCDRRLAYLPQDVVIHESLTPAAALGYIARLKQVSGRGEAISAALERVGLADKAHVTIQRLSGGQRKRVALAAELLGDPRLLLLDEATSGLDPATEEEMMDLFRSLAREGRTVICITHFPGRLHLCDRLLFLISGRCVFQGTPDELKRFFKVSQLEDAYTRVAEEQQKLEAQNQPRERYAEDCRQQFRKAYPDRENVPPGLGASGEPIAPPRQLAGWRATLLLTLRYLQLQLADRRNLLLLFAQAPVIGLMVALTFGSIKDSYVQQHAADTKQVLFVLVIAVLWCSGMAGVREVVKEMPIVRHERRFGLALWPYLLSKVALLGVIVLVQALALLVTVRWFTELTGPADTQFLVLAVTALVGVALGLCVSTFAGTSERAMTILPVLLIGQAIFSGGLARLSGLSLWIGRLFAPAYWSLDGLRSQLSAGLQYATYPGPPGSYQPPILGRGGPLVVDLFVLALQAAALLLIARLILRRQADRA